MATGVSEFSARTRSMQGEEMLQAEEVAAMVRLHELGWGSKRLSREFGCARNTVRRYLRAGGVFGCGGACAEPEAVIAGLEDVAVMGEPIEERGGHLGIAEHTGPFAEAEIGGDDDAGSLVESGEQLEQQRAA